MQQVLQLVNRATKESLVVHSARSAKIVQQEPFKNKTRCQAQSAKLVQLVGNNRWKGHLPVLASIGKPLKSATKKMTCTLTILHPVHQTGHANRAHRVVTARMLLLGKI